MKNILYSMLLTTALLSGSHVYAESETKETIHYGRVSTEAPVDVKNHTGEGALIGGVFGAMTSGVYHTGKTARNIGLGSAIGAATGAGLEHFGEWRVKGTRFTIESVEGETLHIITDQTGVRIGDCVAIEVIDKHANLRRVSDAYCEAAAGVGSDPHLKERAKQSAAACHQAKKALLQAKEGKDLEQAKLRVRALCDT